jgi:hypothetical protein
MDSSRVLSLCLKLGLLPVLNERGQAKPLSGRWHAKEDRLTLNPMQHVYHMAQVLQPLAFSLAKASERAD